MADCVLFVNDEQNVLNAAKRILRADPVTVLTACGASEGIELLKGNVVPVIVSDHMMPGMTGIEFLEWSKSVSPDSVRVLVTGSADLGVAIDAINRGEVFRFLAKPWHEQEVRRIVLDSISRYRLVAGLKSADEAKLLSLAQTIELKDPYTKGHCERVANYAARIASALGLPEEMKKDIRYGSWLHDCGKIGVPDLILNSPDALRGEHLEIVKRHPRWGADVAKTAMLPPVVVNIALYHHERYDGKGYPAGLRGTNIPVEARIVAIADAYDALTSDRPYRSRLPQDEAIARLYRDRLSCFDPDLIDIFLSTFDEDNGE